MTSSAVLRRRILEVAETVLLTVVIFFGIQAFVAQPYQVQQVSMETTFLPGQYVLVDKLSPRWSPYARGDIIVFNPPPTATEATGTPFIKRVIGLPGDTVELKDGRVYVNGARLDEPYVYKDQGVPQATDPERANQSVWLVPAGDLFVLGDHRFVSQDSRTFGPVAISSVIGRAWLRYWPFDTFGIVPKQTYAATSG